MGTVIPAIPPQYFTNSGTMAAGYKLFSYAAGTTTKQNTYTDAALTVLNANPIILDSAGRADIRLLPLAYKFVLAPPTDTDPPTSPIWTRDNVSGAGSIIEAFTANAFWAKSPGALSVTITCIGGGGSGGTGRRGAAGTIRGGGGGGGTGAYQFATFPANILSSSEQVTIGAGGTSIPGVTVNDTNGSAGVDGNTSSFGNIPLVLAAGGLKGAGGTNAAGGAGGGGGGSTEYQVGFSGGAGGDGTTAGTVGTNGSTGFLGGGGGGAGGINAANTASNGADGGQGAAGGVLGGSGGVSGVSNATAGASVTAGHAVGGGGGGGGAGNANLNGASAGLYGSGGGGGGGSLNGTTSGAGGAGAQGIVVVMQVI